MISDVSVRLLCVLLWIWNHCRWGGENGGKETERKGV